MDGEVTAYVYDAANRLTSAGGVEYTWDQNGNLLDDGVRTYEYDYADVLVQVVSGTFTTTFAYNGDGHRVAKAENGVTTTYVVAVLGLSQVLVETTDGSSIRYVYGHDLLAEHDGEAWAWHLNDGLGSVRQLADGNGEVTLAQGYTPFGVPMWNEGNGSTGYGFTGERWEAYTGLLFLRARYYEPGMGRFISKDPWSGDAQRPLTLHGWSYSQNNPSNTIDPTGMMPTETSVQSGAHSFSCRCGWIDWGHASPRTARAIKDGIQCELELDLGSPDYKVIDTGSPFPLTGGLAVVGRHLSEKEQKQVALGIFMSLEEEVEELQSGIGQLTLGAMKSGWAMEDLPSNLIGFYVAWETNEGISSSQLKELVGFERHPPCYVLNEQDSLDIFYVFESAELLDEKNRLWAPLLIPGSCPNVLGEIAEKCHGVPRGWPEQYARIVPEPERKEGKWWWWEGLGNGEQVQRACCRTSHGDIGNVFYYFPCVFPCGSVP